MHWYIRRKSKLIKKTKPTKTNIYIIHDISTIKLFTMIYKLLWLKNKTIDLSQITSKNPQVANYVCMYVCISQLENLQKMNQILKRIRPTDIRRNFGASPIDCFSPRVIVSYLSDLETMYFSRKNIRIEH